MSRLACKTVYKFDELSDDAKEKAMNKWREDGLYYEWWDSVYEDAKTIAALMGITVENIYFSGFWSQGDGACFEGSYEYKKGGLKAIMDYTPTDTELHRIAKGLQELQRANFYGLGANVKHRGHYSHEHCTVIDVYDNRENGPLHVASDTDETLADLLRDFMRWIYKGLEQEWEYLDSDEQVSETLIANEYDFLEDGKFYF